MPNPLLLYSTNTLLAYHINQTYYGELHYVWCSAFFGADNIPSPYRPNPPSSSPKEMYENLLKAVDSIDRHSEKIRLNKAGLRRGATFKQGRGDITDAQRLEIFDKVRLIYVRFRVNIDKLVITIATGDDLQINAREVEEAEQMRQDKSGDHAERRGWGLKLIETLMYEVEFEGVEEGTRLRMTKYRRGEKPNLPLDTTN